MRILKLHFARGPYWARLWPPHPPMPVPRWLLAMGPLTHACPATLEPMARSTAVTLSTSAAGAGVVRREGRARQKEQQGTVGRPG